MADGAQRFSFSIATRPHPSQTYFIASNLSLHMCVGPVWEAPQKLQLTLSPHGLHKCPGSLATAPQFVHVYAIGSSFLFYLVYFQHSLSIPFPMMALINRKVKYQHLDGQDETLGILEITTSTWVPYL